jgi:predicted TIM-barrel fold metal-dependent hydrolase
VRELGFCGALVNDHLQGHYVDEPRYDEVRAALEEPPAGSSLPPCLPARCWRSARTRSCSPVDYPYESSHEAVAGFERTLLSGTDRHKIAHGNAERILRL